jgi:zinc transport system substrate-binding protein
VKKRPLIYSILLLIIFFLSSGSQAGPAPVVFVSILPQKFFVQQISGNRFAVEVMVPPGASPHIYEPKPSQMRKLAVSKAFFTIGVALERVWLDKIATINPDMVVVRTEADIDKIAMADEPHDHPGDPGQEGSEIHDPGHSAQEGEDGLDPHIWLSPSLVKRQVKIIRDHLVELDPSGAQMYNDNYAGFIARIEELDARLRNVLHDQRGRKFMVFHPSWGYFAASYGLEQVAVEIEGKSPKPAQLKALIKQARDLDIRVVFAQPQFSRKSAEVIAREIDGEVVLVDPLAEDWFENMSRVAEKFSAAAR